MERSWNSPGPEGGFSFAVTAAYVDGAWQVSRFEDDFSDPATAERAARRPAPTVDLYERARAELRARPVLAQVALNDLGAIQGDGEFVLLVARRDGDALSVVAQLDGGLIEQAVRRAAA